MKFSKINKNENFYLIMAIKEHHRRAISQEYCPQLSCKQVPIHRLVGNPRIFYIWYRNNYNMAG